MFKTRYTITTTGSRTVVRRIGPCSYPIARAMSPGSIEKNEPAPARKSSSRNRAKKKR